MTSEEINAVINNLCEKLGTTASQLLPEIAKMKTAECVVTTVIITCITILTTIFQCKHELERGVGHWVPKEHWVPLPPNTAPLSYQNYNPTTNSIKTHYWHCSECDYVGDKNTKPIWNFCPHCGADMMMKGKNDGRTN